MATGKEKICPVCNDIAFNVAQPVQGKDRTEIECQESVCGGRWIFSLDANATRYLEQNTLTPIQVADFRIALSENLDPDNLPGNPPCFDETTLKYYLGS